MTMMVTSTFAALALAISGPLVVWPLLRRPGGSAIRADYDLRVYRDQLDDVERDLQRQLMTPDQAAAARLEIQRRMLAAATEAEKGHQSAGTVAGAGGATPVGVATRRALAVMLAVMIPVGSMVLYLGRGHADLPDRPFATVQAERLGIDNQRMAEIQQQISTLTARLGSSPADQAGWIELARLQGSIGGYGQAMTSWDRAVQMGPVSADTWASVGETDVLANDGTVTERGRQAFISALRQDRTDARARYYMGLAAMQGGDGKTALAIWRDLSATSPSGAPWLGMLRSRMAQVARNEGILPIAVEPAHPLDLLDGKATVRTVEVPAAPAGEASGGQAAAGQDEDAARQQMIGGMVQKLKDRLQSTPDDFEGWMMLGRSMGVLKRWDEAASAYGRAAALKADALDPLLYQADALLAQAASQNMKQPPEPFMQLAARALALAPDNVDALYLGGVTASLRGDKAEARRLWEKAIAAVPADSDQAQTLKELLDGLND